MKMRKIHHMETISKRKILRLRNKSHLVLINSLHFLEID